MARVLPDTLAQDPTGSAGHVLDLAQRLKVLEDFLRTYTDAEALPGVKYVISKSVPDGATADLDIAIPVGITIKVIDAKCIKTANAAGANANTMQVKSTAVAITDAMPLINDAVGDIERALSIAPAAQSIVGPGILRFTRTKAAGDAACDVYVECLITA